MVCQSRNVDLSETQMKSVVKVEENSAEFTSGGWKIRRDPVANIYKGGDRMITKFNV